MTLADIVADLAPGADVVELVATGGPALVHLHHGDQVQSRSVNGYTSLTTDTKTDWDVEVDGPVQFGVYVRGAGVAWGQGE